MINAVSNLKVGNSKKSGSNYQGNSSYMSGNINHSTDTFSKSKNISFKGNLASEAIGAAKRITKELPVVKKSLIAAASDLIHEIGDTGVTITIPLPHVDVTHTTIAGARDLIVPHVQDLAGEALKEGVSAAGHEAVGAVAEGAVTTAHEHGIGETIHHIAHEIWTHIF